MTWLAVLLALGSLGGTAAPVRSTAALTYCQKLERAADRQACRKPAKRCDRLARAADRRSCRTAVRRCGTRKGTADRRTCWTAVRRCGTRKRAADRRTCWEAVARPPRTAPAPKLPAAPRDPDAPAPAPAGEPAPTATPAPSATPTATPTPTPVYPSRTGVDLVDGDEWTVRPTYRILAAGSIDFVAENVGEDDHDLSVRHGSTTLGSLPLAPDELGTLTLTLSPGTYTLFCSLPDHEAAGMRATISVR